MEKKEKERRGRSHHGIFFLLSRTFRFLKMYNFQHAVKVCNCQSILGIVVSPQMEGQKYLHIMVLESKVWDSSRGRFIYLVVYVLTFRHCSSESLPGYFSSVHLALACFHYVRPKLQDRKVESGFRSRQPGIHTAQGDMLMLAVGAYCHGGEEKISQGNI